MFQSYIKDTFFKRKTNYIKNKNNRTLDLIFTDIQNSTVFKGCSLVPLTDDHHLLLDFTCNLDHLFIVKSSNDLPFYNFIKCDFSRL